MIPNLIGLNDLMEILAPYVDAKLPIDLSVSGCSAPMIYLLFSSTSSCKTATSAILLWAPYVDVKLPIDLSI